MLVFCDGIEKIWNDRRVKLSSSEEAFLLVLNWRSSILEKFVGYLVLMSPGSDVITGHSKIFQTLKIEKNLIFIFKWTASK